MTFEELEKEADLLGYKLVKKITPFGKMLSCPICGRYPKVNRPWGTGDWFVYCKGHLEGPHVNNDSYYIDPVNGVKHYYQTETKHDSELKARIAWNDQVKIWKESEK